MSTPLPRDEFLVTQRYAYLNHAATGVIPCSSLAQLEAYLQAHAQGGVLGAFPYERRLPEFRERIGRFIGAAGDEIAVLSNTSAGANAIALGLDWTAGDGVLLCDNEFPSNAIPWLALRERGVAVRLLDTSRERLTPDVLRREISPHTRAVAVSWVSYADGYRHDLAGLAEAAHAAGAILCVDAIQGLGAFPIDVRALGVDALYSGAQKWLLGLQGAGFLYVRSGLLERLRPAAPGWRSVADIWDFANFDQPLASDASRFEGGTPSFLGALSMACAIDVIETGGPAAIAAHVLALTDRLVEGLQRCGAELLTLRGEGISSGIVAFRMPGCESVALGRALQHDGVIVTWRPTGIRVSPHGYNTADEIDRLVAALPECLRAVAANTESPKTIASASHSP